MGSLRRMATLPLSSRANSGANPHAVRGQPAGVVPLRQRPGPLAPRVDEGTRRESIRMELLLARADSPRGSSSA
jgi:hypothetical protein